MKDFEGVKRIKNVNSVTIENLYEVLSNYKKAIGELKISEDNTRLFADTEGKYYIDIYFVFKVSFGLPCETTRKWQLPSPKIASIGEGF